MSLHKFYVTLCSPNGTGVEMVAVAANDATHAGVVARQGSRERWKVVRVSDQQELADTPGNRYGMQRDASVGAAMKSLATLLPNPAFAKLVRVMFEQLYD